MIIRPATAEDIPAITAIYNAAGVGTTASYDLAPVTVQERMAWFEAKRRRRFPVLVAVEPAGGGSDEYVIGFASYGPFRDKAAYDFTVEHSVYVDEERRAGGVGRMLMHALIDYARGQGVHVMVGVIDGGNQSSLDFHRGLGFKEAGRIEEAGRKFGRWLDVVLMTLTFPDHHAQG